MGNALSSSNVNGDPPSTPSRHQQHERQRSRDAAEQLTLQESPRRRRYRDENSNPGRVSASCAPTGALLTPLSMGLESPPNGLPLPSLGCLTSSQRPNILDRRTPALAALDTFDKLRTAPPTRCAQSSNRTTGPAHSHLTPPRRRSAVRRTRLTRSCAQTDAPEPQREPNRRSLAQQARRARERAAREASASSLPSTPAPNHCTTAIIRSEASNEGLPTPRLTQAQRLQRSDHENIQELSPANLPTPPPTLPAQHRGSNHDHENDHLGTPTRSALRRRPAVTARRRQGASPEILFMAARRPYQEPTNRHDLGRMNVPCQYCGALHWDAERTNRSRPSATPEFGTCCDHGKVKLPPLQSPPPVLSGLLEANDPQAREFRHNIRAYNMALAFTSLGVKDVRAVNEGFGGDAWVFKVQGQLSHLSGALEPAEGQAPKYAQLYLYDPQVALQQRMQRNSELREDTMATLQNMLSRTHWYSARFLHAYEILRGRFANVPDAEVRLRVQKPPTGEHPRRYNAPTADEVALIVPDSETAPDYRDIVLRRRMPSGTPLYRIHEGHPGYSPLHYVLLFPYGENGWHEGMPMVNPRTSTYLNSRISQTRHASYRIQVRPGQYSTLLRGGRLFQQYLVDMWACADQDRLRYLRKNQNEVRASLYSGLEDAIMGDGDVDLSQLGKRVILPSSYMGGPRHMQQRFQDAMAIARRFRKVDIFMTVTANPKWEEITRELLPGQTAFDRPDLVARVFQLKKQAILEDIRKHGIFGRAVAHVYTIEFQKRGLPHMHILIFLEDGQKLLTPEDIDACISAEWPDPDTQPKLFETVMTCMIHGPCGPQNPYSPCMENGHCTKFYPKDYQPFTRMDEDGFPLYRRRNDGRVFLVGHSQIPVDNRWIVPHCPYLSAKYNCHINVECAVMLRSVKYPFKYIHKGGDRAAVEVEHDEIRTYLEGRYIAAPEAVWRIFHFSIHDQKPNVVRLPVHLPGQHMVKFNPNEDPAEVLRRAECEETPLTKFFEANLNPGPLGNEARKYTYQEFPEHFVWNSPRAPKAWALRRSEVLRSDSARSRTSSCRRRRGQLSEEEDGDDVFPEAPAIGRMYFVSPSAGERFYLRTLLTVVRGSDSFKAVRTYNDVEYPTFREACLARGLLEDDGEWRACLREAAVMQTGTRLRHLFAILLLFCNPAQPELLWAEFRHHICDDLHHRLLRSGYSDPSDDDVYDFGLYLLDQVLKQSGRSLQSFNSMPQWTRNWTELGDNPMIAEQLDYNCNDEQLRAEGQIRQLNNDQRRAFETIIHSVENALGWTYFLDGPGGTGKTFVYNTLCHYFRSKGLVVLCVASSGIAALLMIGGRTAHSRFKIPIDGLTEGSVCDIPKESHLAGLLRVTRLILWDEALMQHRYTHEALDRSLRDIRNCDHPFGGITVVFGGDFQQTLPVVPKGSQEEIVAASLPRSYIWSFIRDGQVDRVLHLRQNMRLDARRDEAEFAQWLLDVGHGQNVDDDGMIPIPEDMRCNDLKALTDFVYPRLEGLTPPPEYFLDRTILAARNSDVDDLNEHLLTRMSGASRTYISADSIENEDGLQEERVNEIPVEYLRSLNAPGLPPGELSVKPGCPLILLRNLSPAHGLCNGSRMIVRRAGERVLEVELIGGQFHGDVAFIPRITLTPSGKDGEFTFILKRRQFPVRLAFSMTINKAQGQSVRYVGLDLREPVFSHGQLYVALSRATSRRRIKVLLADNMQMSCTMNIVYPEVLID